MKNKIRFLVNFIAYCLVQIQSVHCEDTGVHRNMRTKKHKHVYKSNVSKFTKVVAEIYLI